MNRCVRAERNRRSHGTLTSYHRRFENASSCKRPERHDSRFDKVDVFDTLGQFLQNCTFLQRNTFKEGTKAGKINQGQISQNGVFRPSTGLTKHVALFFRLQTLPRLRPGSNTFKHRASSAGSLIEIRFAQLVRRLAFSEAADTKPEA
jgi:hypothetical protein